MGINEKLERETEKWRKWKEKAPEIPCDILADSIDDPLVRMFEALTTFDIGLDREYDEPLLRKAISDIEEAKSMSERIREKAISADKRLEELFPKSLHDVLLHDLSHIKELMEGVLLEKVTGEELADAVFDVDKAWKIPLWRLYHECKKLHRGENNPMRYAWLKEKY